MHEKLFRHAPRLLPELVVVARPGSVLFAVRVLGSGRASATARPFVVEAQPLGARAAPRFGLVERVHHERQLARAVRRFETIDAERVHEDHVRRRCDVRPAGASHDVSCCSAFGRSTGGHDFAAVTVDQALRERRERFRGPVLR